MTLEKSCPLFYHQLPTPSIELDYSLWMPGYEWKPEPVVENEETVEEDQSARTEEELSDQLAEMVEEDEIKKEFDGVASGGKVSASQAGNLARRMGLAPSKEDIAKYAKEHGDSLDYKVFQKFMASCTHPDDNPENFADFFRHYDPTGSGYITKKQLKNLLQTWGEPLSDAEADYVIREFAGASDKVVYAEVVERIMQK